MKTVVKIEDLNFKYNDEEIFKNLYLEIKENTFTTILGENGSGKTTLLKLLIGIIKGNSVIMLNNLPVVKENLNRIRKEVSIVFENNDQCFVAETVTDELAFTLENLNYPKEKIKQRINEISKTLKIENILEKEPHTLNENDKQLVTIATSLITKPKILIIDEGLNDLNEIDKIRILKLLKTKTANKELTVIYLTHNTNDSLFSDNIVILNDKKVLISDTKEEVYKNENNFKKAHLELPFIINLSKKLQFYNLIDKDYQDAEKMVNDLWK